MINRTYTDMCPRCPIVLMKADISKKFILFDFDGVIADSLKTALSVHRELLPGLSPEGYLMALEGNINDWSWAEELSANGQPQDLNFFDFYVPRMRNEVGIFPGIGKTIKELSKKYNLIIISSSLTEPIAEFLEKNNLRDCFIDIMGNDIHHSKAEKIKMVFSNYGIESDKCVFITDTLGDVREASQMNVGAIGVSWGFHPRETLVRGKCFRIVDCPEDIPEAVSEYLALDFIK